MTLTIISQIIGAVPRAPSPTDFADDSLDADVSDPELALIARRVKSELRRNGTTPVPEGGGPTTVKLNIVWRPHPLDPHGKSEVWAAQQKRVSLVLVGSGWLACLPPSHSMTISTRYVPSLQTLQVYASSI